MVNEKKALFIIASIQFINLVDFMMVVPLGPDFGEALGIPTSALGVIGGSYTLAAFITGLLGAFIIDRYPRKKALLFCLTGLLFGTALGGFAFDLTSLIAARMVAGAFGGPASALSIAMVSDTVPEKRRGRAMGLVMGAFSASSVLGVPFALEIAMRLNFRAPFFALTVVGLIVLIGAWRFLPTPPQTLSHSSNVSTMNEMKALIARKEVRLGLAVQFITLTSGFLLIPNLSAYFQFNAHFPRERIGTLYLIGGLVSFFAMRFAGILIDKEGVARVIFPITVILLVTCALGFLFGTPHAPVYFVFLLFMISQSVRNVSVQTTNTKIPSPIERGRFQSLQSAIQHLAISVGAISSTFFLAELPGKTLDGFTPLTSTAMALSASVPFLLLMVEKRLKVR